MLKSLNTFKWYDNLWAAFIFFTRLPFWRLRQPPQQSYAAVVEWWPLTGWLTAAVMAATLYFGSMFLPYPVAIILAIVTRLFTTRYLLGLFDETDFDEIPYTVVECDEHLKPQCFLLASSHSLSV